MQIPHRWRLIASGLAATGLMACGPVNSCSPTPAPAPTPCYVFCGSTVTETPSESPSPLPEPPVYPIPPIFPIGGVPTPTTAPAPAPSGNCVTPYHGSATGATVCISQGEIDEWKTDVANNPYGWVLLYYGSIDNGSFVSASGLAYYPTPYVSTDNRVAVDTACNPRHLPSGSGKGLYGSPYDRWIAESNIPVDVYLKYFTPPAADVNNAYGGWSGELYPTNEIKNLGVAQVEFFNYGIDNWGMNLLPDPTMSLTADVPPGCGPAYYALPYAHQNQFFAGLSVG